MKKSTHPHILALALVASVGACRGGQHSTDAGTDPVATAKTEVLIQLNERSTKIVDFAIAGVRCAERCGDADAPTQAYRLQMRSPGYFRIELPADDAFTVFDGKQILAVDNRRKTYQRIALDPTDKNLATLPYGVLNAFLVEGWHAPLLVVAATDLRGRIETAGGNPLFVLERPLQDAELDRVEFWFRLPRADFVKKRFVQKSGQALKTVEVDSEHLDPRTGYSFAKSWRTLDGAGAVVGFNRLTEIAINSGVAMSAFAATIPAGYTETKTTP